MLRILITASMLSLLAPSSSMAGLRTNVYYGTTGGSKVTKREKQKIKRYIPKDHHVVKIIKGYGFGPKRSEQATVVITQKANQGGPYKAFMILRQKGKLIKRKVPLANTKDGDGKVQVVRKDGVIVFMQQVAYGASVGPVTTHWNNEVVEMKNGRPVHSRILTTSFRQLSTVRDVANLLREYAEARK